jgi:YidC/Oxa1 family membrane protein insertase
MDRNSIIGLVLIGAILIGFSLITKPKRDAQLEAQRTADSIAMVENIRSLEAANRSLNQPSEQVSDTEDVESVARQTEAYGDFAAGLEGAKEIITMENDLLKVEFSTLGGRPYTATLKEYLTHDTIPVRLFYGDSTKFNLQFFADNRRINTGELYFVPDASMKNLNASDSEKTLTMRMDISETAHIDYIYTMYPDDYMMDFSIRLVGMDRYRTDNVVFNWEVFFPSTEKGYTNESNYSNMYYRFKNGDIEKFNMRSKKSLEEQTASTQIDWIAYKQQFFSTVLIAQDHFEGAYMSTEKFEGPNEFIRHFISEVDMPYDRTSDQTMAMNLYFGPNEHQRLKEYEGLELKNLVTVGGPVIKFLNEIVIIPIFNWLNKSIANYGLIIFLLTLILKTALFPLTYRSYKSQAVMRVLKPQVDEIGAKFPKKEDAMKKQQATMALYKKAGANPLGGCLPMVAQMPILYAMFRFFPTSIELRQEKFLWATDLSTYDSILDLPWDIPMYGDHISLFTILMTVTTVLSMRINNQTQANSAMPGMKTMMYIMPVMFMFILNNFSAALTYYYFLANLITLAQNFFFKRFTDEAAILKKINSKQTKAPTKSKWQQRMEKMTKQQQQMQKQRGKK